MFVVMALQRWTDLECSGLFAGVLIGKPSPHYEGFLPVYETREAALEEWPEAEIVKISIGSNIESNDKKD